MQIIKLMPWFGDLTKTEILNQIKEVEELLLKADVSNAAYDKIYMRADGDSVGAKVGIAFMNDDVKAVHELSEKINAGQQLIANWALGRMGQVVLSGGDDVAIIVPATISMEEVEELRQEYLRLVGATLSIGIGDTPSQAAKAMLFSKLTGKDKITTWNDDIHDKMANMDTQNPEWQKLHNEGYLEKGLGDGIKAAAIAAGMMLSAPTEQPIHAKDHSINQASDSSMEHHKHSSTHKHELHPELDILTHVESSGGKNKDHPEVTHGLNKGHRAGGKTGLMPITVLETIKKNPDLAEKYHHITKLTPNQITEHVNNHEDFEAEIANRHWKRLGKVFGNDKIRKVFAWNQGITGAKRASESDMLNHPYVQKYIKHAGRSIAENKSIAKNEGELYRIHVDGNPVTHPMTMKQLKEKHGDLSRLEKDPSIRIVPHKSQPNKPKKGITFIKNEDVSARADHYSQMLHEAKKKKRVDKDELMLHAAVAIKAHDVAAQHHKKTNNEKATGYHKRQAKEVRDFAHSLGTDHSGIMRRVLNKKEAAEPCLDAGQEPLKKPYTSEAQRKWAHTKTGTKALGGKEKVREWDKKTKGKKLPEKVK